MERWLCSLNISKVFIIDHQSLVYYLQTANGNLVPSERPNAGHTLVKHLELGTFDNSGKLWWRCDALVHTNYTRRDIVKLKSCLRRYTLNVRKTHLVVYLWFIRPFKAAIPCIKCNCPNLDSTSHLLVSPTKSLVRLGKFDAVKVDKEKCLLNAGNCRSEWSLTDFILYYENKAKSCLLFSI